MIVSVDIACKYWVSKEIDVPDAIAEKLMNNIGSTIDSDSELADFLGGKIHEEDAYEWEFEVEECEEIQEG